MAWNPEDPIEKQKRIAWSVATSTSVQTREDPVMIYNRLMERNKRIEAELQKQLETSESQISGNA